MFSLKDQRAQSLVEFVAGLALIVPLLLVLMDLGLFLTASQINASLCHEVARAAASGSPEYACKRAQAVLSSNTVNLPGATFKLLLPVETKVENAAIVESDSIGGEINNYGGSVNGTASVSTEVLIKPLVLHYFLGSSKIISLKAKQICPIRYVLPSKSEKDERIQEKLNSELGT